MVSLENIKYGPERIRKKLNMDQKGLKQLLNMDQKGLEKILHMDQKGLGIKYG